MPIDAGIGLNRGLRRVSHAPSDVTGGEADSELRIYYSFKTTSSERVVVDIVRETGAAKCTV